MSFYWRILLLAVLTAICTTTNGQNMYADCATNFTLLEDALLGRSDNVFQLTSTYFHPNTQEPLYVRVHYSFSNSSTEAHYIWSAATLYFIIPPLALRYLSLYYGHFHDSRMANLSLQLPEDCVGIINETCSTEGFLFVLTQRLQIYAKYYRSMGNMILDGVEGRVVCQKHQDIFSDKSGVITLFSFVLGMPLIVCVIYVFYVRGLRSHIKNILTNSDHYPSQAALMCVGQTFTLFVIYMDIVALKTRELRNYMFGTVITVVVVELVLFILISVFVFLFCFKGDTFFRKTSKAFKCIFFPLLGGININVVKEVQSWFVVVGLIPSLVCLSSHIPFILEGGSRLASHGTAVTLFFLLSFVYLFVVFKSIYAVATKRKLRICNCYLQHQGRLHFQVLLIEMMLIPFVSSVPLYIAYGFVTFPAVRAKDEGIIFIYNLGSLAVIFVLFFITYIAAHKKSSGIVHEDMLKYWMFLDNGRDKPQPDSSESHGNQKLEDLNIDSNTDKVNALNAVLVFHLLKLKQGEIDHCEQLLLKVAEEAPRGDVPGEPSEGTALLSDVHGNNHGTIQS